MIEPDFYQALAEHQGGPIGLIHVDAHSDTSDAMCGEKLGHGTPFKRAFDEGLLKK